MNLQHRKIKCRARRLSSVSCSTRGFALIEATMAMSVLSLIGVVLLQLALSILTPRQLTLSQTLTDAYLSYERALAERVPFEELTSSTSQWPISPATTSAHIEIGKLPGGRPLMGTVYRTRLPDPGNLPADGGTGTAATNPANIRTWRVQAILSYQVGGRTYLKSRTVIRSQ